MARRTVIGIEGARSGRLLKGEEGDFRSRIGDDDLGIQEADKGNEEADTGGNSLFQGHRNGVENGFADIGQGQDDENDPFNEDGC